MPASGSRPTEDRAAAAPVGRGRGRRWLSAGVVVAALALAQPALDATAPRRIDRLAAAPATGDPPPLGSAAPSRRVILVSIDGLAPWVLRDAPAPTLARLAREGASASVAETVVPSITLVAHTSMLSGRPPGDPPSGHGVDWNQWRPWQSVGTRTLFDVCAEIRLRCGLVAGKVKFAHYAVDTSGALHWSYGRDAGEVLRLASAWLREADPDFLFVHLAEVDATGHADGWGSEAQRAAIARVDELLGRFLDAERAASTAPGGRPWALIVTADHGGHGSRHGSDAEDDVRIPWIAWGDGVPSGVTLPHVKTLDTAATVLALLGREGAGGLPGRSALADAGVPAARSGATATAAAASAAEARP